MVSLLKTTSQHWEDISREWNGVRRHLDADSVHDLRVASRRAASSLLLLEAVLQENQLKCRRRIKRLMKKMGSLRDVQVQISLVKKWKPSKVVEAFLDSLRLKEKEEGRLVRKYLSSRRKEKIRRSFKNLEHITAEKLKSTPAGMIRQRIEATLRMQRATVMTARAGMQSSDPQTLHALRVAAKKLRYSLEAARSIVGAPPRTELQQLLWYQTRLGHMRDVQILREKFEQWQRERAA